MSYRVERFVDGEWVSLDGFVFDTEAEAVGYAKTGPMRPWRTPEVGDGPNYRWQDGKLVPGAAPREPVTWQDYVKGLSGITITLPTPQIKGTTYITHMGNGVWEIRGEHSNVT